MRGAVASAGDDEDGGGVSALPQEFLDRQNAARDVAGTDGDASTSYGPDEKTRKQHEMCVVLASDCNTTVRASGTMLR